jgi:RNase P subunit RPR2
MERLTEKQKQLLRKMVDYTCEECNKHERTVGKLIPHRIVRGSVGGKYIPRNIKLICKKCHKLYHFTEPK